MIVFLHQDFNRNFLVLSTAVPADLPTSGFGVGLLTTRVRLLTLAHLLLPLIDIYPTELGWLVTALQGPCAIAVSSDLSPLDWEIFRQLRSYSLKNA